MSSDREVTAAGRTEPDPVNHPPHYAGGSIECIEAIEAVGIGPAFCQGNAIKYLWRLGKKGDSAEKKPEDAKKARWYVERLIEQLTKELA